MGSANVTDVKTCSSKPSPIEETRWYAIYLRSRFEKKVQAELVKKEIECFLPLIEEVRRWSDRKKRVQVPLFPGYLFVKIDLRNRLRVLHTDGVVRFVGPGDRISAIPEEQINWIGIVVGHPGAVRREEFLSVGEKVEVVAGPFKGIRGIVTRLKGAARVVIALEAISQAVSVEVAPEYLESMIDGQKSMRQPLAE